jgi:hypothetical protein
MYRLLLLAGLMALPLAGQVTTDVGELAWMAGHWGPEAASKKVASEEHWIAPAGGMMLAVSRTIAGGKVVQFEFLRIETRADGIYYVAQPGGKPPVAFKLTKAGKNSATFENPTHDNPKIITYQLDGTNGMVATLEGDERGQHKKQSFRFEKVTGR